MTRQRQVEHDIRELNSQLEQRVLEIRELNAELEQRVYQRTINLEEAITTVKNMQDELVRSGKMAALGSLVAGIAHELNTPIGNSVTVASTMQMHANGITEELVADRPSRSILGRMAADMLKGSTILLGNLSRAAMLITSFKQVAVDQSSDQRRPFNLKQTLENVVLTLEPMYKNHHHIALELMPDLAMDSYPGALTQVVTNFVSNAINHGFAGREGGQMRITTCALSAARVQICFSDDGAGIAPEYLERVFDPFFTTTLGKGGSGLGMSIVYNLVTGVLGGTITLACPPTGGTQITLILPCKAPDMAPVRVIAT